MSIWYYVLDAEQMGPVSEGELSALAAGGKIGPETLIWREGMEDWVRMGEAPEFQDAVFATPPPPEAGPTVWCAECGRPVAEEGTMRYGERHVCASCKPTFVQRLKEGGSLSDEVEFAGVGIRLGALVLDMFIFGIPLYTLVYLVTLAMGTSYQTAVDNPWLQYGLVIPLTALEAWFVFHYGGTPGKLLLKLRIVNEDGARISLRQAIGRSVWSSVLTNIPFIGLGLYAAGCLKAAFNPERRALHDDVFRTRVIRKE